MRRILFIVSICFLSVNLFSVKLIFKNKIKTFENLTKEMSISDLADSEIYQPIDLQVINDFIIIRNGKPTEIVKLDFNGKILAQNENMGRGPGEFRFCISPRKVGNKIAILDIINKVIFFDMNLMYVKEIKLPKWSREFLYLNNKYFIFSERAGSDFYLSKYSVNGKLLEKFGKKEGKYNPKDELAYLNRSRLLAYNKIRDIIWCDNLGKYELRSYKRGNLKDLVRPEKELFEKFKTIDENSGEKITAIDSKSIRLLAIKDRIYYFFNKKEKTYLDVFDLGKLSLIKRILLKNKYILISYIDKNAFFGISYDEEGDPVLYKIEIL